MIDKSLLTAALEGLELQKQRIEEQIQEVKQQLGAKAAPAPSTASAKKPRKRVLSAVARKRIAAAQKKRWAEYRKKKQSAQ
jgi:hypothetical protein